MTAVVGVHGISQQQTGGHELARNWGDSLADGIERARGHRVDPPGLQMAFYGDLFLPVGADGFVSKAMLDKELLGGLGEDEVADLLTLSQDLPANTWPEEAGPDKGLLPKRVPAPLQALAQALDRQFGAAAWVLMLGELRQVRRYLTDPAVTVKADARVSAALTADARVLIGHSLGSVVAFEWARKNQDVELDLLLTVGSPLGLRMVRSRLDPAATGASVEVLPNVGRWVNVYDRGDVVACACPLAPYWPGVFDHEVHNGDAPHAITRYLNKQQTGLPVADVLGIA